jgi:hypothetical protein
LTRQELQIRDLQDLLLSLAKDHQGREEVKLELCRGKEEEGDWETYLLVGNSVKVD